MCVYLHTKFSVFRIIVTSFRLGVILPFPTTSKRTPKNPTQIRASKWIHYDKLSFLVPVTGASKSRDTLKRINLQEHKNEKEVRGTTVAKRKTFAEKKLDLLSKCTEVITANANTK